MYGFGEELTKENILKRITSYDIFRFYSENFMEVGKSFCSDLPGREDKNPSAQVSFIKGDLLYSDFGIGKSYRAISYVMEKYGLKYPDALQLINRDFKLGLGVYDSEVPVGNPIISTPTLNFKEKTPSIILKKRRDFNELDREYWNQYSIQLSTLSLFNIEAISHYWINGVEYRADKLAYSYNFYFEHDIYRRKIYQPKNKMRFIGNGGAVVQGEIILPKEGDVLIITKSFKDVLCLFEMGWTAIAPTSETSFVPDKYFEKQRSRFNKVYLLYDNDTTGQKFSKKFSEQYGIPSLCIPIQYVNDVLVKDISDYVKANGKDKGIELIKTQIE